MKKLLKLSVALLIFLLILCTFSYYEVERVTKNLTTSELDSLPNEKVALVLGTSAYIAKGRSNLYFDYRIQAAAGLYHEGKVDYILVSGDNRKKNYNEPLQMTKALQKKGVPQEKIILDYAGFRTLDSMIRAKKVFGQNSFIVVSQNFHNERAVYIARYYGIKAYGFNARDVNIGSGFKINIREVFARVKMILDLYVLKTEPKFLGEEIIIGG